MFLFFFWRSCRFLSLSSSFLSSSSSSSSSSSFSSYSFECIRAKGDVVTAMACGRHNPREVVAALADSSVHCVDLASKAILGVMTQHSSSVHSVSIHPREPEMITSTGYYPRRKKERRKEGRKEGKTGGKEKRTEEQISTRENNGRKWSWHFFISFFFVIVSSQRSHRVVHRGSYGEAQIGRHHRYRHLAGSNPFFLIFSLFFALFLGLCARFSSLFLSFYCKT